LNAVIVASGQESKGRRAFLELGGNGGFGSINFETDLKQKKERKYDLVFRTGIATFPQDQGRFVITFPNSINFLFGNEHKLELGVGQTVSIATSIGFFTRTTFNVGYRYETKKRLFYRITYTPLVSNIWNIQYQHFAGVSMGIKFKSKQ